MPPIGCHELHRSADVSGRSGLMPSAVDRPESKSGLFRGAAHGLRPQLVRYFIGGAIAFFCDLAILSAMHAAAGMDLLVAGALAFCVGVTLNYVIAIRWVFPERSMSHRRGLEFAVYFGVGLTGLALNELVLWGLAEQLGLHFVLAKGVSGLVVLAWTFVLRRTLLFRKRRQITHRYDVSQAPRPVTHRPATEFL